MQCGHDAGVDPDHGLGTRWGELEHSFQESPQTHSWGVEPRVVGVVAADDHEQRWKCMGIDDAGNACRDDHLWLELAGTKTRGTDDYLEHRTRRSDGLAMVQ